MNQGEASVHLLMPGLTFGVNDGAGAFTLQSLPLPNTQKHNMLMLDNPVIRLELMHDVLDEHGLITS